MIYFDWLLDCSKLLDLDETDIIDMSRIGFFKMCHQINATPEVAVSGYFRHHDNIKELLAAIMHDPAAKIPTGTLKH